MVVEITKRMETRDGRDIRDRGKDIIITYMQNLPVKIVVGHRWFGRAPARPSHWS